MNIVYFGEELAARAPDIMGCLCVDPIGAWINLQDVIEAIRLREPVSIRPASAGEMQRAESCVVLYEIGKILGAKLGTLLDQEGVSEKAATGLFTSLRDEFENLESSPVEILDRAEGA